jgi:hypothetical protein
MSELVKALIAARKEMTAAKKGKDNPFFKSKYADLSSVIQAVKDPLEAHGLTFVQDIENGAVVTVLMHESGETMRLAPFPVMSAKQDAQGVGSGVTYARRYSLQTALGVPAEDDDGNAASQPAKKFPSPVKSALEGVDPALIEKANGIANTLIDLHSASEQGQDVGYTAFETVETMDNELKLAVWNELAQHSKVRSWIKKVTAEHRGSQH